MATGWPEDQPRIDAHSMCRAAMEDIAEARGEMRMMGDPALCRTRLEEAIARLQRAVQLLTRESSPTTTRKKKT